MSKHPSVTLVREGEDSVVLFFPEQLTRYAIATLFKLSIASVQLAVAGHETRAQTANPETGRMEFPSDWADSSTLKRKLRDGSLVIEVHGIAPETPSDPAKARLRKDQQTAAKARLLKSFSEQQAELQEQWKKGEVELPFALGNDEDDAAEVAKAAAAAKAKAEDTAELRRKQYEEHLRKEQEEKEREEAERKRQEAEERKIKAAQEAEAEKRRREEERQKKEEEQAAARAQREKEEREAKEKAAAQVSALRGNRSSTSAVPPKPSSKVTAPTTTRAKASPSAAVGTKVAKGRMFGPAAKPSAKQSPASVVTPPLDDSGGLDDPVTHQRVTSLVAPARTQNDLDMARRLQEEERSRFNRNANETGHAAASRYARENRDRVNRDSERVAREIAERERRELENRDRRMAEEQSAMGTRSRTEEDYLLALKMQEEMYGAPSASAPSSAAKPYGRTPSRSPPPLAPRQVETDEEMARRLAQEYYQDDTY